MRSAIAITTGALALILGVGAAGATCPVGPTSFGGDDSGYLTCNKVKSKCEQKVAGNYSNLWAAIIKCHAKAKDLGFKQKAFDEETCETTALNKFVFKTNASDCPCVSTFQLANLAEAILDSSNSLLLCDSAGTPFGGDDTGFIPTTKAILKCEDGLLKCVPKLVKAYTKCHQTAAKSFVANKPFDEEACEAGPIPGKPGKSAVEQYNACTAKVLAKGGCQGCEDSSDMLFNVDQYFDGDNGLIYCSSPSGAFIE